MFHSLKKIDETEKWLLSVPCSEQEAEMLANLKNASGMPSPADANASAMQYYALHRAEFYALAEKFWQKKAEISSAICRVSDRSCRVLLIMRYLLGKSWQEIADEMHISERHVYRLRKKALKALCPGRLKWEEV